MGGGWYLRLYETLYKSLCPKNFAYISVINPSLPCFLPFTQNILRHPYLKILDLAKFFFADAPMKKIKQISLPPPL